MDCCNYVQPYSGTGHFYHQQNFYYENMNAYTAYSMTPASNAMESNVRYNRLPPAYPTDYVYNPKEARLRKAMREQSRELSRQSILQTAVGSASGTVGGNVSSSGVVTSSNFLQNHPMSCSSSAAAAAAAAAAATAVAVSSMPTNNQSVNSGRIINPWFPVGPTSSSAHLKPIISPRIMAAHQRTLEKTKEAMRQQVECSAGGFSSGTTNPSANGYGGGDFAAHNAAAAGANDYCIIAEFGDGQKWHPYQNGGNPYHGRGAGMSKVGLHPNPNVHVPWAQFCGLPIQTSPASAAAAAAQNPTIRPARQMVFLQEQQGQHCTFSDEMQMAYVQNKMEVNPRLHPAYPGQGEPQVKTSVSPPQMQQLQDDVKCNDQVPQGWDSAPISGSSGLLQDQMPQDQEEDVQPEVQSQDDSRQKPTCKQPLPGFHQAFGSTEIGRFSRSEFFANMVGESSNVSRNVGSDIEAQGAQGDSKNCSMNRPTPDFPNLQPSSGSNFGNFSNFGNVALAAYYNEVRTPATPVTNEARWHSPYVGVIGSEI